MSERTLQGCRVVVIEDEYMLADELAMELDEAGAVVLGPVGTLNGALNLITSEAQIDGAVLDVNLGGEMAFPVADLLIERKVPFVFSTGYEGSVIPSRFACVVRCEKPINIDKVTEAIGRQIHRQASG